MIYSLHGSLSKFFNTSEEAQAFLDNLYDDSFFYGVSWVLRNTTNSRKFARVDVWKEIDVDENFNQYDEEGVGKRLVQEVEATGIKWDKIWAQVDYDEVLVYDREKEEQPTLLETEASMNKKATVELFASVFKFFKTESEAREFWDNFWVSGYHNAKVGQKTDWGETVEKYFPEGCTWCFKANFEQEIAFGDEWGNYTLEEYNKRLLEEIASTEQDWDIVLEGGSRHGNCIYKREEPTLLETEASLKPKYKIGTQVFVENLFAGREGIYGTILDYGEDVRDRKRFFYYVLSSKEGNNHQQFLDAGYGEAWIFEDHIELNSPTLLETEASLQKKASVRIDAMLYKFFATKEEADAFKIKAWNNLSMFYQELLRNEKPADKGVTPLPWYVTGVYDKDIVLAEEFVNFSLEDRDKLVLKVVEESGDDWDEIWTQQNNGSWRCIKEKSQPTLLETEASLNEHEMAYPYSTWITDTGDVLQYDVHTDVYWRDGQLLPEAVVAKVDKWVEDYKREHLNVDQEEMEGDLADDLESMETDLIENYGWVRISNRGSVGVEANNLRTLLEQEEKVLPFLKNRGKIGIEVGRNFALIEWKEINEKGLRDALESNYRFASLNKKATVTLNGGGIKYFKNEMMMEEFLDHILDREPRVYSNQYAGNQSDWTGDFIDEHFPEDCYWYVEGQFIKNIGVEGEFANITDEERKGRVIGEIEALGDDWDEIYTYSPTGRREFIRGRSVPTLLETEASLNKVAGLQLYGKLYKFFGDYEIAQDFMDAITADSRYSEMELKRNIANPWYVRAEFRHRIELLDEFNNPSEETKRLHLIHEVEMTGDKWDEIWIGEDDNETECIYPALETPTLLETEASVKVAKRKWQIGDKIWVRFDETDPNMMDFEGTIVEMPEDEQSYVPDSLWVLKDGSSRPAQWYTRRFELVEEPTLLETEASIDKVAKFTDEYPVGSKVKITWGSGTSIKATVLGEHPFGWVNLDIYENTFEDGAMGKWAWDIKRNPAQKVEDAEPTLLETEASGKRKIEVGDSVTVYDDSWDDGRRIRTQDVLNEGIVVEIIGPAGICYHEGRSIYSDAFDEGCMVDIQVEGRLAPLNYWSWRLVPDEGTLLETEASAEDYNSIGDIKLWDKVWMMGLDGEKVYFDSVDGLTVISINYARKDVLVQWQDPRLGVPESMDVYWELLHPVSSPTLLETEASIEKRAYINLYAEIYKFFNTRAEAEAWLAGLDNTEEEYWNLQVKEFREIREGKDFYVFCNFRAQAQEPLGWDWRNYSVPAIDQLILKKVEETGAGWETIWVTGGAGARCLKDSSGPTLLETEAGLEKKAEKTFIEEFPVNSEVILTTRHGYTVHAIVYSTYCFHPEEIEVKLLENSTDGGSSWTPMKNDIITWKKSWEVWHSGMKFYHAEEFEVPTLLETEASVKIADNTLMQHPKWKVGEKVLIEEYNERATQGVVRAIDSDMDGGALWIEYLSGACKGRGSLWSVDSDRITFYDEPTLLETEAMQKKAELHGLDKFPIGTKVVCSNIVAVVTGAHPNGDFRGECIIVDYLGILDENGVVQPRLRYQTGIYWWTCWTGNTEVKLYEEPPTPTLLETEASVKTAERKFSIGDKVKVNLTHHSYEGVVVEAPHGSEVLDGKPLVWVMCTDYIRQMDHLEVWFEEKVTPIEQPTLLETEASAEKRPIKFNDNVWVMGNIGWVGKCKKSNKVIAEAVVTDVKHNEIFYEDAPTSHYLELVTVRIVKGCSNAGLREGEEITYFWWRLVPDQPTLLETEASVKIAEPYEPDIDDNSEDVIEYYPKRESWIEVGRKVRTISYDQTGPVEREGVISVVQGSSFAVKYEGGVYTWHDNRRYEQEGVGVIWHEEPTLLESEASVDKVATVDLPVLLELVKDVEIATYKDGVFYTYKTNDGGKVAFLYYTRDSEPTASYQTSTTPESSELEMWLGNHHIDDINDELRSKGLGQQTLLETEASVKIAHKSFKIGDRVKVELYDGCVNPEAGSVGGTRVRGDAMFEVKVYFDRASLYSTWYPIDVVEPEETPTLLETEAMARVAEREQIVFGDEVEVFLYDRGSDSGVSQNWIGAKVLGFYVASNSPRFHDPIPPMFYGAGETQSWHLPLVRIEDTNGSIYPVFAWRLRKTEGVHTLLETEASVKLAETGLKHGDEVWVDLAGLGADRGEGWIEGVIEATGIVFPEKEYFVKFPEYPHLRAGRWVREPLVTRKHEPTLLETEAMVKVAETWQEKFNSYIYDASVEYSVSVPDLDDYSVIIPAGIWRKFRKALSNADFYAPLMRKWWKKIMPNINLIDRGDYNFEFLDEGNGLKFKKRYTISTRDGARVWVIYNMSAESSEDNFDGGWETGATPQGAEILSLIEVDINEGGDWLETLEPEEPTLLETEAMAKVGWVDGEPNKFKRDDHVYFVCGDGKTRSGVVADVVGDNRWEPTKCLIKADDEDNSFWWIRQDDIMPYDKPTLLETEASIFDDGKFKKGDYVSFNGQDGETHQGFIALQIGSQYEINEDNKLNTYWWIPEDEITLVPPTLLETEASVKTADVLGNAVFTGGVFENLQPAVKSRVMEIGWDAIQKKVEEMGCEAVESYLNTAGTEQDRADWLEELAQYKVIDDVVLLDYFGGRESGADYNDYLYNLFDYELLCALIYDSFDPYFNRESQFPASAEEVEAEQLEILNRYFPRQTLLETEASADKDFKKGDDVTVYLDSQGMIHGTVEWMQPDFRGGQVVAVTTETFGFVVVDKWRVSRVEPTLLETEASMDRKADILSQWGFEIGDGVTIKLDPNNLGEVKYKEGVVVGIDEDFPHEMINVKVDGEEEAGGWFASRLRKKIQTLLETEASMSRGAQEDCVEVGDIVNVIEISNGGTVDHTKDKVGKCIKIIRMGFSKLYQVKFEDGEEEWWDWEHVYWKETPEKTLLETEASVRTADVNDDMAEITIRWQFIVAGDFNDALTKSVEIHRVVTGLGFPYDGELEGNMIEGKVTIGKVENGNLVYATGIREDIKKVFNALAGVIDKLDTRLHCEWEGGRIGRYSDQAMDAILNEEPTLLETEASMNKKSYWSVYDIQTGGYLYSGRDSLDKETAIEGVIDYIDNAGDLEDCTYNVEELSMEQKEQIVNDFEFRIVEHDEEIGDGEWADPDQEEEQTLLETEASVKTAEELIKWRHVGDRVEANINLVDPGWVWRVGTITKIDSISFKVQFDEEGIGIYWYGTSVGLDHVRPADTPTLLETEASVEKKAWGDEIWFMNDEMMTLETAERLFNKWYNEMGSGWRGKFGERVHSVACPERQDNGKYSVSIMFRGVPLYSDDMYKMIEAYAGEFIWVQYAGNRMQKIENPTLLETEASAGKEMKAGDDVIVTHPLDYFKTRATIMSMGEWCGQVVYGKVYEPIRMIYIRYDEGDSEGLYSHWRSSVLSKYEEPTLLETEASIKTAEEEYGTPYEVGEKIEIGDRVWVMDEGRPLIEVAGVVIGFDPVKEEGEVGDYEYAHTVDRDVFYKPHVVGTMEREDLGLVEFIDGRREYYFTYRFRKVPTLLETEASKESVANGT